MKSNVREIYLLEIDEEIRTRQQCAPGVFLKIPSNQYLGNIASVNQFRNPYLVRHVGFTCLCLDALAHTFPRNSKLEKPSE